VTSVEHPSSSNYSPVTFVSKGFNRANTANQNSQGTRPATVGQLNEIIEEYKEQYPESDFEDWRQF
jgi:hypothetical protein